MSPDAGLILLAITAAAYLGSRAAFGWLGPKFQVVSGAEYLVLGVMLGPHVSGVLSRDTMDSFAPFVSLAIGWFGAQIGARLRVADLMRVTAQYYRIAIVESAITVCAVSGVLALASAWWLGFAWSEAVIPALALGAIATVTSETGLRIATAGVDGEAPVLRQFEVSTTIGSVVAIVVFGLLLAVEHVPTPGTPRPLTPTEWAVVNVGIGVVGGTLFHLFLGEDFAPDRLFISMTGALILVSGAAEFLRVSPLLAALCFGAVLANTTQNPERITGALERVQRPLYFALLIFGGANWHPSTRSWVLPVLLFLAIRIAARVGGGRMAARWNGGLDVLGSRWGWGLVGQGGLAVAIALSYVFQDNLPVPNIVLTAAICSVLATDLLSARVMQGMIGGARSDAGDANAAGGAVPTTDRDASSLAPTAGESSSATRAG